MKLPSLHNLNLSDTRISELIVIRHVISEEIIHIDPGVIWGGAARSDDRFGTGYGFKNWLLGKKHSVGIRGADPWLRSRSFQPLALARKSHQPLKHKNLMAWCRRIYFFYCLELVS